MKVDSERICGNGGIKIGNEIPLSDLSDRILSYAQSIDLPILVNEDSVKVGGGIFVRPEPCLVIFNRNHKSDYYNYILLERNQGSIYYLFQYLGGNSKNYTKEVASSNIKGIASLLFKPNGKKQQEEHIYYDAINSVIAEAVSSFA